jgi:hypothetical protein
MLDYVTDDFTWLSYGTNLMDAAYRADYVTENYSGFEIEEIGDRTERRAWPWRRTRNRCP